MSEIQIIQSTGLEVFEAQERAAIDTQVATAKRYPRALKQVRDNSIAIATMDKGTAEACRFAKPVGGKSITGPSVHLARIIAQQYGNIRVQQRIKQITDKAIIAEAVAFDMETNYAVCVEARRSIVDKKGVRYQESVIETNAMAVMAIAERNAILKVIPKAITDAVYNAAFQMVNGELTDETKLIQAKTKAFAYFKDTYNATEAQVLGLIGLRSANQIDGEQIANLRAIIKGLKDGEITDDELFGKPKQSIPAEAPQPEAPKVEVKPTDAQAAQQAINFDENPSF